MFWLLISALVLRLYAPVAAQMQSHRVVELSRVAIVPDSPDVNLTGTAKISIASALPSQLSSRIGSKSQHRSHSTTTLARLPRLNMTYTKLNPGSLCGYMPADVAEHRSTGATACIAGQALATDRPQDQTSSVVLRSTLLTCFEQYRLIFEHDCTRVPYVCAMSRNIPCMVRRPHEFGQVYA